jgi:hypothetical protein
VSSSSPDSISSPPPCGQFSIERKAARREEGVGISAEETATKGS